MQTCAFAIIATNYLKDTIIINVNSSEGMSAIECVVDEVTLPRVGP